MSKSLNENDIKKISKNNKQQNKKQNSTTKMKILLGKAILNEPIISQLKKSISKMM